VTHETCQPTPICCAVVDEIEILVLELDCMVPLQIMLSVVTWMINRNLNEREPSRSRATVWFKKCRKQASEVRTHTHARTHPASRRPDETMESATCLMSASLMLHPK
jgi:hypothetical protein